MARRVLFFLATTIAVTIIGSIVIGFIMQALGISIADASGATNYPGLAVFCFLWGMGGSFISLLISKWMAKNFHRVQIVDERGPYSALVRRIHHIARKAGLDKMPEVGIYPSQEINAFATGPSRNNSLVAVSEGLLRKMDDDEVEGVLAHEVAHIANGDMVTMMLVQGVVNSFVLFLSWIVTQIIDNALRDRDGRGGLGFFGGMMVRNLLYGVFAVLAAPVVMWFSRYREYRADAGSALLVGKQKMRKALMALQRNYPQMAQAQAQKSQEESGNAAAFQAMHISNKLKASELFSSHPPLEKRIQALDNLKGVA